MYSEKEKLEKRMEKVLTYNEIVQCVKLEIERACENNTNAIPDVSYLIPELKYDIVDTMLLHTRGNQAKASRILGINRGTLRKIYNKKKKKTS